MKILEDFYYNIFYKKSILYNRPILFIYDVQDANQWGFFISKPFLLRIKRN